MRVSRGGRSTIAIPLLVLVAVLAFLVGISSYRQASAHYPGTSCPTVVTAGPRLPLASLSFPRLGGHRPEATMVASGRMSRCPDLIRRSSVSVRLSLPGSRDKPIAQIAEDLGISDSCLRGWVNQADVDDGRTRRA